jgi:phenylacetate-CoA ligase
MESLKHLKKDLRLTWRGAYTRLLKRHFGPFAKRRAWLEKTQYYSADQLKMLQLELLQYLIRHVYETVPFYRAYMQQEKFTPEDIQSLQDIERFPILTKTDLKREGAAFVSTKFKDKYMRTVHTGGTTGATLPIRRDIRSIQIEHAFVRRQFDWASVTMSDRVAYLTWRRVAAPNDTERLYGYDAALKELHLSTINLSEANIQSYAETMRKYRVKALNAYPSAAFFMAKGLLEKNETLPLKAVLTTSETLGPAQREIIEKAFECPVFDYYGSAERVCYIHTCKQGSYHILPEYGLTELIPAEGQEGAFRLVATGFWNLAMPLIRYDIGDLVQTREGACSCGRAFPMIQRIVGREGTYIRTPSGRVLGAMAIEYILARVLYSMYKMPILEGQIIQEAENLIVLEFVAMQSFTDEDEQRLLALLREEIPNEMQVSVRKVDKMRQTVSGKHLSFASYEHH